MSDKRSSLEIFELATGRSRVVLETDALIEAPNWDPGGATLLVNGGGRLFRVALEGRAELHPVATGFADACNNDHGISPDGTRIALSHDAAEGSTIYLLPAEGGEPVQVTARNPSYWHGWSPDGATLAFCGARGGRFDIFTIAADGGKERRLTEGAGHNDGPDYAADGSAIWFNSDRSGAAQIWRMETDGAKPRQVTDDGLANWFPHPSPDGRLVLYLAYAPGTQGHPRDREVALRLMDPDGRNVRTVLALFGGQGTINVPCWAPDGSAFAFIRYARAG
ncbi:MAG: TolB family protein [Rhodobacteraceae bacterium]|nr:TolB family protein [Paracoccaceae bacterium]